jgi:hypothetical protein
MRLGETESKRLRDSYCFINETSKTYIVDVGRYYIDKHNIYILDVGMYSIDWTINIAV